MGDRAGTAWRQLQLHSARVGGRFTVARSLRSIGEIARLQHVFDNEADYVTLLDMLAELREDNLQLAARMRETRGLCDSHGDVATARRLEAELPHLSLRRFHWRVCGSQTETDPQARTRRTSCG